MRRAVPLSLALSLAGVVALTGCGSNGPLAPKATPGSPAPTSTSSTGTASPGTTPTAPSPTRVTTTSLTGTVSRASVEGNCLVLTSSGRTYLLVGDVRGLTPGQQVSVTGHVDAGVVTTCQTGTPFVVESVQPTATSAG